MRYIFSLITGVLRDFLAFFWPKTTASKVLRLGMLAVVLIGGAYALSPSSTEAPAPTATPAPVVSVGSMRDLSRNSSSVFIGTVRAVSEVDMQFEVGGRVTSVPVSVGQYVRSGTVLATVENAAQRAAVLQAQGSYDAATAAAALSTVSIADAERAVQTAREAVVATAQTAYSTSNVQVRAVLDQFFSRPDTSIPGVRIDTDGNAGALNSARSSLTDMLPLWEQQTQQATPASDLTLLVNTSITNIDSILFLTDTLTTAVNSVDSTDELNGRLVSSYAGELSATRSTLTNLRTSLQNGLAQVSAANDALARAQINAPQSGTPSASSAQITQALGSLRAAQAQLEKTIVRAPISGTVDVLRVRSGEYVSANTPVALVTGASGLEVSLFVGERDADLFVIGSSVQIDGTASGTVASVSVSIDPLTLKREVIIALDNDSVFSSGDTVNVSLEASESDALVTTVPITAIKFTNADGVVFVIEDGVLVAVPVEVGAVANGQVTILSGIDPDTRFVIDARGKSEGTSVTIAE